MAEKANATETMKSSDKSQCTIRIIENHNYWSLLTRLTELDKMQIRSLWVKWENVKIK